MNQSTKHLSVKDFLVTGETFQLVYDSDLDILRTIPAPKLGNLPKYYESEDYISHTDDNKGFLQGIYQLVKKWALRNKVKLINSKHNGVGTLLDVGAGTGDFLISAKNKGWEVHGMEPNSKARNIALDKGLDLNLNLKDYEGKQFDVVTLWHVLEHIPDLREIVSQLSSLVKTGGFLIIAVPNYKSYDAKYYGSFWAAYDVPRHLWHFSKESIKKLFSSTFILEEIKPMIFDSFYVSLLSEKYKTGNKFSIKALWVGLRSNLYGMGKKEYSSHIYCFRKK